MPLTKTRTLIADLATAAKLPALPPDKSGGYELNIGDDTTVLIYGEDDETILVVVPIGPLPEEPGYALTAWLLGLNGFNSDIAPFRVGLDQGGEVIMWGRLEVDELTGETLAALLGPLSERAKDVRDEVVGEEDEEAAPAG